MILPLEKQVCALKYAKRLKELGVPQEGLFIWIKDKDGYFVGYCPTKDSPLPSRNLNEPYFICFAYTVAELGRILPRGFIARKFPPADDDYKWECWCWKAINNMTNEIFYASTEANARSQMLIYLIENGLLKVEDLCC